MTKAAFASANAINHIFSSTRIIEIPAARGLLIVRFFARYAIKPASVNATLLHILRPKVPAITLRANAASQRPRQARPPTLEVKMKLTTRFELAAKSKTELHALLREAFNELARGDIDKQQRLAAAASIQNIKREISSRVF